MKRKGTITEGKTKGNMKHHGVPDIPYPPPPPPPPPKPEKNDFKKDQYVIHVVPARDVKNHQKLMNEMYEIGYIFHSSYALGGNEVALRFVLK